MPKAAIIIPGDVMKNIFLSAEENLQEIKRLCSDSADILSAEMVAAGHRITAVWCDGMVNNEMASIMLFKDLKVIPGDPGISPKELALSLVNGPYTVIGTKLVDDLDEALYNIMSGSFMLFIEGSDSAVMLAAQGFQFRSVSESYTEENVRGSREGFVEPLRINMTLIRRKLKTRDLVFRIYRVGKASVTDVAMVFINGRAPGELVEMVEKRLRSIDMDLVLESGFLQPFFENQGTGLFSGVGHTERPDTLSAKLWEGRVAILVDGAPFALLLPQLFYENFQAFDDYTNRPYYSSFIRVIRFLSFFIAFLLPGLYVASASSFPDAIPIEMFFSIASAQQKLPVPLMFEALIIDLIYEVVREAGLRLPRPVGHAISLVGALVVGDAAVSAGIVSPTMVMVVAITMVMTFTIPNLYEPITVLRLIFILIGGFFGYSGIVVGLMAVIMEICAANSYGLPYTAPISPIGKLLFTDGLFVRSKKKAETDPSISGIPGSRWEEQDG